MIAGKARAHAAILTMASSVRGIERWPSIVESSQCVHSVRLLRSGDDDDVVRFAVILVVASAASLAWSGPGLLLYCDPIHLLDDHPIVLC